MLVDAYGGQLYRLGLRFCGNADDAEDLVRCHALFDTLDLARDVCVRMNSGDLPPKLETLLKERYA